jgi:hypothetical protein
MAGQAALTAELTNDPLGRGYAGMTDAEAVADLNTHYRRGDVPSIEVVKYLLMQPQQPWALMVDAQLQETDADKRRLAISTVETLRVFDAITMGDPVIYAVIDATLAGLVAAGYLTADQKVDILAMGENLTTRAQELNLPRFNAGSVEYARRQV